MECWTSVFTLTFGTTATAVVSSTCLQHFTPNSVPWDSFLLVAKWTPGLLNAAQGLGHLKISKDSTGNRNRGLPSRGAVPQPNARLDSPLPTQLQIQMMILKTTMIVVITPVVKSTTIFLTYNLHSTRHHDVTVSTSVSLAEENVSESRRADRLSPRHSADPLGSISRKYFLPHPSLINYHITSYRPTP
jgi:hypothetical protein